MDEKELLKAAKDCQRLARMLGDRQSSDTTYQTGLFSKVVFWFRKLAGGRMYNYVLPAGITTKLVNALLDAGNRLEVIAKEGYTPKLEK